MPGTPKVTFGNHGGLHEMLYAATGFLLVRREVYLKIQHQLALPIANERFGSRMIPFCTGFMPVLPNVHHCDFALFQLKCVSH